MTVAAAGAGAGAYRISWIIRINASLFSDWKNAAAWRHFAKSSRGLSMQSGLLSRGPLASELIRILAD